MGNIALFSLGLFNLIFGSAHLANTLAGDPTKSGWVLASQLVVGGVCVLFSMERQ